MIYLITNKQIEYEEISTSTIEQCLEYCSKLDFIGLDLETSGFDPYTSKILCIQLGDQYNQFVIDVSSYPITLFKELFEDSSKIFIGHNLKFDIRFLYHHGIIVKNVFDTYITEQIIWNGYQNMKKSLDHVCERYTGVFLDKSIRGNIHREGLSKQVIIYAANDVAYLHQIKEGQLDRATKWDLKSAIKLNNLFVPVIAYLEYCGFKLNTTKWQDKINKDTIKLKERLDILNKYIIDNNIYKFINPQLDIWEPQNVTINWNSPIQVAQFFNILGIDTQIIDKESGDIKNTVNSTFLEKKVLEHPLIKIYIEYRELLKRCSTYGENWFKFINPITNRIHTKFQQWITTGRMSSGGKDKDSNIDYPNAQNIPADEETRSCIVAEEGYTFIDADYSGQEATIFANFCKDTTLLKMYEEGFNDMHKK